MKNSTISKITMALKKSVKNKFLLLLLMLAVVIKANSQASIVVSIDSQAATSPINFIIYASVHASGVTHPSYTATILSCNSASYLMYNFSPDSTSMSIQFNFDGGLQGFYPSARLGLWDNGNYVTASNIIYLSKIKITSLGPRTLSGVAKDTFYLGENFVVDQTDTTYGTVAGGNQSPSITRSWTFTDISNSPVPVTQVFPGLPVAYYNTSSITTTYRYTDIYYRAGVIMKWRYSSTKTYTWNDFVTVKITIVDTTKPIATTPNGIYSLSQNDTKVFVSNKQLNFISKTRIDQINLYDVLGQIKVEFRPSSLTGKLDLAILSSGYYIVTVVDQNNQKKVQKIWLE